MTLTAACAWQVTGRERALSRLAGPIVLADVGFVLLSSQALLAAGTDRGVGLAVAALTLGVAWLVLRRAQPDLALVLGAAALALGAVAVGNLVSGDGLTLAWAAESAMLSLLAYRFRDARLQLAALGYLGLATGHLLAVTEPVGELFQTSSTRRPPFRRSQSPPPQPPRACLHRRRIGRRARSVCSQSSPPFARRCSSAVPASSRDCWLAPPRSA